jgi:hypothetical protein
MTHREAAGVKARDWRVRHPRATLTRRSSAVWLCAACLVVLTCVGASYANAQAPDAHQATAPMCCFKLSIFDSEVVSGTYTDASGTGQDPAGQYYYHLFGAAYGLAVLEPPNSGVSNLLSTYGGVAAAQVFEGNSVTFAGNPSFGCPEGFPDIKSHEAEIFRRAALDTPGYTPPRQGTNGGGGLFDFGHPFNNWAPQCNEFSDAAHMVERVLGGECGEPDLLSTPGDPGGGPICNPGANPTKALLNGEHRVRITCTEQASGSDGNPSYSGRAEVAIVINIVHVSPDDRKHQLKALNAQIGTEYNFFLSPSTDALSKLDRDPSSNGFLCSSSS